MNCTFCHECTFHPCGPPPPPHRSGPGQEPPSSPPSPVDLDPVAVVEVMVDLGISTELVRAAASALLQCTSLTTPIVVAVLRGAGVPAVDAIKIRQQLIKVCPLVLVVVVDTAHPRMNARDCVQIVCMLFVLCVPAWVEPCTAHATDRKWFSVLCCFASCR